MPRILHSPNAWYNAPDVELLSEMSCSIGADASVMVMGDCKLISGSLMSSTPVRQKLRRLTPTGSVDFDRQRLLLAYDSRTGGPSTGAAPEWVTDEDIYDFWNGALGLCLESDEPAAEVTYFKLLQFLLLLIDKLHSRWCEVARFKQRLSAGRTASGLRQRLRSGLHIKALHTPLQIFPESIHPIELSA